MTNPVRILFSWIKRLSFTRAEPFSLLRGLSSSDQHLAWTVGRAQEQLQALNPFYNDYFQPYRQSHMGEMCVGHKMQNCKSDLTAPLPSSLDQQELLQKDLSLISIPTSPTGREPILSATCLGSTVPSLAAVR